MSPRVPRPLLKYVEREEIWLSVLTAWILAPFCLTLVGLFIGTIVTRNPRADLQAPDLIQALWGAGLGLLIGVAVALFVTIWYPGRVRRDHDQHLHPIKTGPGHDAEYTDHGRS
jgi:H+/Cl- antiporter ClcA